MRKQVVGVCLSVLGAILWLPRQGDISSKSKESSCDAGDQGSIPRLGSSSGEGNSNPLQYSGGRIPRTEKPVRLQSMGSQRVGHICTTNTHTHANTGHSKTVINSPKPEPLRGQVSCDSEINWVALSFLLGWPQDQAHATSASEGQSGCGTNLQTVGMLWLFKNPVMNTQRKREKRHTIKKQGGEKA